MRCCPCCLACILYTCSPLTQPTLLLLRPLLRLPLLLLLPLPLLLQL